LGSTAVLFFSPHPLTTMKAIAILGTSLCGRSTQTPSF